MGRLIFFCTYFTIFFLFTLTMYSQTRSIKGNIVDDSDDSCIPNVSVYLKDTRIGTVSDKNGNFTLNIPTRYEKEYLYFTGIALKKDSILIKDIISPLTVRLFSEIYQLSEVYVMPDSTLLTLLRRAYDRIPENYPNTPTLTEGFYRESAQYENGDQVDFIEAVLSVYKDSYQKPSDSPGQIELIKSRKRKIRDIGILYYGGPFQIIKNDFVLSRAEFIQPKKFRNYNYKFKGIKTLNGSDFYVIDFHKISKDSLALSGTMLVEKESLAYVSFDIDRNKNSLEPQIKQRSGTINSTYEKIDGKWHLKYSTLKKEDIRRIGNKKIYGAIDYIALSVRRDSINPIPFEKQLQFFDPLIVKADEYDGKGWTDYKYLEGTDLYKTNFEFSINESTKIFEKKYPQTKAQRKMKLISILTRFSYDLGLSYRSVSANEVTHDISFQPNSDIIPFRIQSDQKHKVNNILIQSALGYKLTKNISLLYQGSTDLFNKSISVNENSLGIGYSKNLKKTGSPLFIETSLMYSFNSYYSNLGKYDNPSEFRYKGKKIDSNIISFDYGYKYHSITPQIALAKRVSRIFSIKMYMSYDIHLFSDKIFRVKEEKGGLFSKKKIELQDDDKSLSFSNYSPWDSFSVNRLQIGVLLRFN
ncbi:MAG: carboxypeptidase-like regulatory domain-containing protein [Dysgonomonas sp.]